MVRAAVALDNIHFLNIVLLHRNIGAEAHVVDTNVGIGGGSDDHLGSLVSVVGRFGPGILDHCAGHLSDFFPGIGLEEDVAIAVHHGNQGKCDLLPGTNRPDVIHNRRMGGCIGEVSKNPMHPRIISILGHEHISRLDARRQ